MEENEAMIVREICSDLALQLRDAVSLRSDLQFSLYAITELENRRAAAELKDGDATGVCEIALWNSAIIAFFKCFATGSRKCRLEEAIYSSLPGDPIGFFNVLRNIRSKLIAHAISTLDDGPVGAIVDQSNGKVVGIVPVQRRLVLLEPKDVSQFKVLIQIGLKEVNLVVENLSSQILAEVSSRPFTEVNGWKELEIDIPEIAAASKRGVRQAKGT